MERHGKALKEDEVAVVCRDTLEGLLYLQKVGIVHNDIKVKAHFPSLLLRALNTRSLSFPGIKYFDH